jgi:quinol monooxygenase YgiN
MIAVLGSFRFAPETVEQAKPLMAAVVAATLAEPGCLTDSYAEDVTEPAHFETPHMREWVEQRAALGFSDRRIALHQIGAGEEL